MRKTLLITCPYCRNKIPGTYRFRQHLKTCGMGRPT